MNNQDQTEPTIAIPKETTRSTQTILTSQGLISMAADEATFITPSSSYSESTASLRPDSGTNKSDQSTQAAPPFTARYNAANGSLRSSGDVLRIATSFTSENSAGLAIRNETITLTTDYENRVRLQQQSPRSSQVTVNLVNNNPAEANRGPAEIHSDSPPPTIFFEPRVVVRTGHLINWIPCCRRNIEQEETDSGRGRPPSYSVIFPSMVYRESSAGQGYPAVLMARNPQSTSFVARTPPPSYAQAQGICVAYSLEQLISSTTSSDGRIWSPRSTTAVCPRCACLVFTMVEVHQAAITHVAALTLFFLGCWPCCLLPYCIDSCKTSHHYCPFCRTYLGTYEP